MRSLWVPLLGLLALSLAIYWNTLGNALVYDDNEAIVNNEAAHGLQNAGRIVTTPSWWPPGSGAVHYRPIPTLTYAVNYSLHRLEPAGYHLGNSIFHGLTAGLVYLVLLASGVATIPAFIAAVLFLTHPIHVEAVAWGIGRADILAASFILLSLLLHIHATRAIGVRRVVLMVGGLLAALGAGLCKESGYLAPLVVLAWDVVVLDRLDPRSTWRRIRAGAWLEYGLYLGMLAGFWGLRSFFVGGATVATVTEMASPLVGASFFERLLTGSYVMARYIGLLLWPAGLSVDYSPDEITRVTTLADPRALLGLGTLLALLALAVVAARWSKITCFALVVALLVFAPSANIIFPVGTIMADRLMYLPVLALCVPLALGLWQLRRLGGAHWIPVGLAVLLVVGYSARTVARNADWKDDSTLFRIAYEVSPRSAMANKNLASALAQQGRYGEALPLAQQAVSILPTFPDAHLVLGNSYFMTGQQDRSIDEYLAAIALVPTHAAAYLNLGAAYHVVGRSAEAVEAFDTALQLNPQSDLAWFNRVHALVALGRVDEAERTLAEAVRRFPGHRAEPEARQKVERARQG